MYDQTILDISIKDYLEGIGITTRKEGNRYFCSSPFSSDRNWSFVIYPTNTYFDFSTGHGGNILNLLARLQSISIADAAKQLREGIIYEKYQPNYKKIKEELFSRVEFDLSKYINKDANEIQQIKEYAEGRGIKEGYFCGVFFTRDFNTVLHGDNRKWKRVPALGFLHVDKYLKPCGAKFRRIVSEPNSKDQSARFSARGNLGFYILDTQKSLDSSTLIPQYLYVVESESSANSLAGHLAHLGQSAVVVSRGGVSSACATDDLPEHLQGLKKKLIIDYDGNEELYNQRLKLYSKLDAQPIKLILPKGEDINSLYNQNKMWMIESLLLN